MSRNSKPIKPTNKRIAVVGDGQTEKIYFDKLKEVEGLRNVSLKPDLPKNVGSYRGVFDKAESLYEQGYDEVYCLIDMDKVLSDNTLAKYLTDKKRIKKKGMVVFESNPCIEFWFLLHFVRTTKPFSNCESVEKELQKYLPNYTKNQQYLVQANIYKLLQPNLLKAIENGAWIEENHLENDYNSSKSEIFKLIKILLPELFKIHENTKL
jgi:RloB-like protein